MSGRLSKWLLYLPVAFLPLLAGFVITTPRLQEDLLTRASANLRAAGGDWGKLAISGRDAMLAGDAPSEEALDAAVRAVAGTYGIRLVNTKARVIETPQGAGGT